MDISRKPSPLAFFGLVFALTVPFWIAGALAGVELLPALPLSALAFLSPLAAACILRWRERGRAGVVALLRRAFDWGRIPGWGWLVPLLLLEPAIKIASFLALRLAGSDIPLPVIAPLPALALFAVFLAGGLGEELGWSGYVTDPLQGRWGALRAALIIGGVWAVWHFVGLLQAHRSAEFIAWWSLGTLAGRVILVWLYNHTGGSVFVTAVYHAMMNLAWQLFPVNGSYYDPRVNGLITAAVALVIVLVWGWGTRE